MGLNKPKKHRYTQTDISGLGPTILSLGGLGPFSSWSVVFLHYFPQRAGSTMPREAAKTKSRKPIPQLTRLHSGRVLRAQTATSEIVLHDCEGHHQVKVIGTEGADDERLPITLTYYKPATLPVSWRDFMFELLRVNMEALYAANWDWKEDEKRKELFDKEARYLVAAPLNQEQMPVGFVHLRFIVDHDEKQPLPVLYVYEIQVSSEGQGQGLGRWMMAAVERMARTLQMLKVKLTVFKSNERAMGFYSKLGYGIDPSSPSRWGEDACYEILSKEIDWMRGDE